MFPVSAIPASAVYELPSAQRLSGLGQITAADMDQIPQVGLPATSETTPSFGTLLGRLVSEVNAKQAAAGETVTGLLAGQKVSLHQAMIAMEEASVSFQLMVEVRNKLLESYQELMRMQV